MTAVTLGTVCHNGHTMQASFTRWVSLTTGAAVELKGYDFDGIEPHCCEDCENIPTRIVDAARDLFVRGWKTLILDDVAERFADYDGEERAACTCKANLAARAAGKEPQISACPLHGEYE